MKRITVSFLIFLILVSPALGDLLLDKALVNYNTVPHYFSGTCNWQTGTQCLGQDIFSPNVKNGQIIAVDDSWKEIDAISIPMRRIISDPSFGSAHMILYVYKSTTDNPATASLYLWQGVTLNISNTVLSNIMFTFDFPLEVRSPEGTKTVNYIFVQLQEDYIPNIDNSNEILYGYGLNYNIDNYAGGKLFQDPDSTGSWTSMESHLQPVPSYVDMAFKVYGTYYIPPTPSPTPTGTPIITPGITPIPNPSDTPPPIPGGGGYNATFDNGTGLLCNNGTSTCNGTIPIDQPGVKGDTLIGGTLKGLGYDYNNDGIISADETIDFLFDFSMTAFILSWLGIFMTRRAKGTQNQRYGYRRRIK